MPRLTATPASAAMAPRRSGRPRPRKAAPPDRLTTRALLWRRLRRSFWPGVWSVCFVCLVALAGALYKSVTEMGPLPSPAVATRNDLAQLGALCGLRISDVQIDGVPDSDLAAIHQVIDVRDGDPTFGFSLRALQTRLDDFGPVQTATVQRMLPGTLIVTISERDALAIWQTQTATGAPAYVVIDQHGKIVAGEDGVAEKRREPGLLLLSGADAPANAGTLMSELKADPAVLPRVVAAARVDGLRWNLILKDETVVKLPVDGEAAAIDELNNLQNTMQLLDRPVEVIDLRLAGKLIVRPYPDANAHLLAPAP